MYSLYFMTSPNVTKVVMALEEIGADYRLLPLDISSGDQRDPSKVAGSVTGKVPVIIDEDPKIGGEPIVIAESGAILLYLAEKHGGLIAADSLGRLEQIQWLFWQVSGLGPFGGQAFHFRQYPQMFAPEVDNSYSEKRYEKIFTQHFGVLETKLKNADYVAGEYSVADIACFPWVQFMAPVEGREKFPRIEDWRKRVAARTAVKIAYDKIKATKMGEREKNEQDVFVFSKDELHNIITT
ncbi:glutathione S-transferase family protein [Modicisalibacter radicis]|uniref:glutathione S-transferase family protein n=1 Tax=Halomonas sp. EAR18 TaxID=2518972 RepID=UPI0014442217|nr:glutathione S-transferase N-terminal domain-containing protein [Halomonas sp. EAR18]